MECNVGDRNGRQVELKRLPALAVVIRDVEVSYGSGDQQAAAARILADYAREVVAGNAVDDLLPGRAVVAGLVKVGTVVVHPIHRRGHVGRSRIVRRSGDGIDLDPLGHVLGSDVDPLLTAIPRDVDEAVIGARPDDAFLNGRFIDCEDGAIVLDTTVVFGDRSPRGALFRLVVTREVRADGSPALAFIGAY